MTVSDDELDFESFFTDATGFSRPYRWQVRVGTEGLPEVLPVPTGLGKTEGVVLAWAWRRLRGFDEPLHLVYCLPMRTLVGQTVKRLNRYFCALHVKRGTPRIPVYRLMGGAIDEEWARNPDQPWVLVGTQDQLLSRALNRGYAMSRFEWPIHFGLLNQDCHWIVDEVQLMGPGLWTTSQLDWMRRKRFPTVKPCRTTWMSATVGTRFLETTDRKSDQLDSTDPFDPRLDDDDNEELRRRLSARRAVRWFAPATGKRTPPVHEQIASQAQAEHCDGTLTLIICNQVKTAQQVFGSLTGAPAKILLTPQFRKGDRRDYERRLLDFEARRAKTTTGRLDGDPGLICVSTQVVEAGVDVSAHRLWSELAPWPSIVQRLGRLNRDGRDDEDARAIFWRDSKAEELPRDGDIWIGPYTKGNLDTGAQLLDHMIEPSSNLPFTKAIAALKTTHGQLLCDALQPAPAPWPRALDVHGLF
jgi:CRISPR-associated endonuclease/helicase Cas3